MTLPVKVCPITGKFFTPTHYNQKYAPDVTRRQKRRHQKRHPRKPRMSRKMTRTRVPSTFPPERITIRPEQATRDNRVAALTTIEEAQTAQEIAPFLRDENWFVRFIAANRMEVVSVNGTEAALRQASESEDLWLVKWVADRALEKNKR